MMLVKVMMLMMNHHGDDDDDDGDLYFLKARNRRPVFDVLSINSAGPKWRNVLCLNTAYVPLCLNTAYSIWVKMY